MKLVSIITQQLGDWSWLTCKKTNLKKHLNGLQQRSTFGCHRGKNYCCSEFSLVPHPETQVGFPYNATQWQKRERKRPGSRVSDSGSTGPSHYFCLDCWNHCEEKLKTFVLTGTFAANIKKIKQPWSLFVILQQICLVLTCCLDLFFSLYFLYIYREQKWMEEWKFSRNGAKSCSLFFFFFTKQ